MLCDQRRRAGVVGLLRPEIFRTGSLVRVAGWRSFSCRELMSEGVAIPATDGAVYDGLHMIKQHLEQWLLLHARVPRE